MSAMDTAEIMKTVNLKNIAPVISIAAKSLAVFGAVLSVGEVILAWALPNPVRKMCENSRKACEQSIVL